MPFILEDSIILSLDVNIYALAIAVVTSLILLLFHWNEFIVMFDAEIIKMSKRLTVMEFFYKASELVASSVFQELFYRVYLIDVSHSIMGKGVVLYSSILFTIEHLNHAHHKKLFISKTYIMQFVLATTLAANYILFDNTFAVIMGHLIYNLPKVYYNFRLTDWRLYERS